MVGHFLYADNPQILLWPENPAQKGRFSLSCLSEVDFRVRFKFVFAVGWRVLEEAF
jgi:hypothetical protein